MLQLLFAAGSLSRILRYGELHPVPLLTVGMLTNAGDDGREKDQAYRLALDREEGVAR